MPDDFDPLEQLAVGFALFGDELKTVAKPRIDIPPRGMAFWTRVLFIKLGAASLLAYAVYCFLSRKIR